MGSLGRRVYPQFVNSNVNMEYCIDSRDASYPFNFARINEVQSLELLHDGTQELHFSTAERWASTFLDLNGSSTLSSPTQTIIPYDLPAVLGRRKLRIVVNEEA